MLQNDELHVIKWLSQYGPLPMLCIIRGHNILKLDKLDFTKHPMARHISGLLIW